VCFLACLPGVSLLALLPGVGGDSNGVVKTIIPAKPVLSMAKGAIIQKIINRKFIQGWHAQTRLGVAKIEEWRLAPTTTNSKFAILNSKTAHAVILISTCGSL